MLWGVPGATVVERGLWSFQPNWRVKRSYRSSEEIHHGLINLRTDGEQMMSV
jgi:hypothetical protein